MLYGTAIGSFNNDIELVCSNVVYPKYLFFDEADKPCGFIFIVIRKHPLAGAVPRAGPKTKFDRLFNHPQLANANYALRIIH